MTNGTVVPKLKSAIGAEGRALLDRFNLLHPLVEQMVASEVAVNVVVSKEQLEQARLGLLQQRGYDGLEQWAELLEELERSEEEVLDRLCRGIRRRSFMRERFAAKAEARFLERKNELDQVVYSLLRLENGFLAQELYLQIEAGESDFADWPSVMPRARTQHHRNRRLFPSPKPIRSWLRSMSGQPGVLLEPFQISEWWLVAGWALRAGPFTDEVSDQMCQEMFDAWIDEETDAILSQLASSVPDPVPTSDFSDFSISR